MTTSKIEKYINEYAWNYGRFYHVGNADKIVEQISQIMVLPNEYLKDIRSKMVLVIQELSKHKIGLSTAEELFEYFKVIPTEEGMVKLKIERDYYKNECERLEKFLEIHQKYNRKK